LGPNDFVFKVEQLKDIEGRNIKPVFGSTPTFLEVIVTGMNEELERWKYSHSRFFSTGSILVLSMANTGRLRVLSEGSVF
jgi:hypothetical protein